MTLSSVDAIIRLVVIIFDFNEMRTFKLSFMGYKIAAGQNLTIHRVRQLFESSERIPAYFQQVARSSTKLRFSRFNFERVLLSALLSALLTFECTF